MISSNPYWAISTEAAGKIVEGTAEIEQSLLLLLRTRRGTDPLRPEFGISQNYLDQPVNLAPAKLIVEIQEAVEMFEPRVTIVDFTTQIIGGQIILTVNWTAPTGETRSTFVNFPQANGAS